MLEMDARTKAIGIFEEKRIQPWYTIVGTGLCKDRVTGAEADNLKKALNIVLDEKDRINNLVNNLTMEEIERLNLLEQQAIICEIENALWRLVKIKVPIRDAV